MKVVSGEVSPFSTIQTTFTRGVRADDDGMRPVDGGNKSVDFSGLASLRTSVLTCLDAVRNSLDETLQTDIDRVREKFMYTRPMVSFVGQVKAGKTALTNAVAGFPRLLPSDVNPLTSVVTALHLNDPLGRHGAEFTFMDQQDWATFRAGGGRMGQMAQRAGLAEEAERLTAQVDQVQARARARLGQNFEMLLGKRHRHDRVTTDLLSRYVCFDSSYEEDGSGRYADIVKTAAVYMQAEDHALPLIFQDTPGVNDPFLIREQATLASLVDTDICVLTLSAAQALNMSDIGLMKIMLSHDPDDVIIFVNRIDELEDPPTQIEEIRHSIDGGLSHHGIDRSPRIAFGSAIWADAVLCGALSDLLPSSRQALERLASDRGCAVETAALALSGVLDLRSAIAMSLQLGVLGRSARTALDQCQAVLARQRDGLNTALTPPTNRPKREEIDAAFDALERRTMLTLEQAIESYAANYRRTFNDVLERFIEDQCALLREHMAAHGAPETWHVETVGWRRELTHQHQTQQEKLTTDLSAIVGELVPQVLRIYTDITGQSDTRRVVSPDLRDRRTLTATAATFVFDLPRPSWRRWLGLRHNTNNASAALRALLRPEVSALLDQIEKDNNAPHFSALREAFSGLISEHRSAALDVLARLAAPRAEHGIQDRLGSISELQDMISSAIDLLDQSSPLPLDI